MADRSLLAVGRVARAHGIRGEVSIQPLTEVTERFETGSVLQGEDGRSFTVQTARPHHHRLLVKFEEVPDRTTAESLRGTLLLVPRSSAPAIDDPDRFWVHEVVGLEVVTEEGRSVGRIRDVLANPANDLWVTEEGTLIPAVREVVTRVDRDGGRIVIRDLEGLVE